MIINDEDIRTWGGIIGGIFTSYFGIRLARFFRRRDRMQEISDRLLKLETTFEDHLKLEDNYRKTVQEQSQIFREAISGLEKKMDEKFDTLTELLLRKD